jgi:hypothetical protein
MILIIFSIIFCAIIHLMTREIVPMFCRQSPVDLYYSVWSPGLYNRESDI